MKKIIFSAAILAAAFANAQNTGIGTTNPQERLDVAGNIRVQSGAKIYAPGRLHISGDETLYLLNKGGVRVSTAWEGTGNLVVEGGTQLLGIPDASADNMLLLRNTDGWVTKKSIASLFSENSANLYNTDGKLSAARIVNMDGKNITWNAGEHIYTNPSAFRLVAGNNGIIFRNDGGYFYMLPSTDQNGLGQWTDNRPFMYDFKTKNLSLNALSVDGNVGIGTTNPLQKLDVNGAFMQVQGEGFNGQKQLAYIGADSGNNDIQVGSLNPNVTDVAFYNAANSTYMNGFMSNLNLNKNLAVGGTTSLQDVPAGASTDNVLVRGADNIVKQISTSAISSASEPWYDSATKKPATSNTQSIYQMGMIGIGTNAPSSALDVRGTIISTDNAQNGYSYISPDGSLELYRNPASTSIVSPYTMGYIDFKSRPNVDGEVRMWVDNKNSTRTFSLGNYPSGAISTDPNSTIPFFVDLTNGFTGINTVTPTSALHVLGKTNIAAQFAAAGDEAAIRIMPSNSLDNRFAIVTNGTRQDTSFNGFSGGAANSLMTLKHSTGNIGIGEANPATKLAINGELSYGNGYSNTLTRNDAGLRGDAGARSGFYQTSAPVNFPTGATNWWHLLDVRHDNTANNYAMQLANSFYDQNLYFRSTNDDAAQSWSRVLTQNQSSGALAIQSNLPVANGGNLLTVDAAGNVSQTPAASFSGAAQNIYTTDGKLIGNRTVNQDSNTIAFTNGDFIAGKSVLTNAGIVELSQYQTGDRNSFIDFHSSDNVDFSSRIIRYPGVDGNFELANSGAGNITLSAPAVATKTLQVGSLPTGAATDKVIVADANGILKSVPRSDFKVNDQLPYYVMDGGGGLDNDFRIDHYFHGINDESNFVVRAFEGTPSAPTVLQPGALVGGINWIGYTPQYVASGGTATSGLGGNSITHLSAKYMGQDANGNSLTRSNWGNQGVSVTLHENSNVSIGYLETDAPQEKLDIKGAIKVGTTNNACTNANLGAIKFENDNFYGCKSTGWVQLNN